MQALQRRRRQTQGEDIDLDAAVQARVDRRAGGAPSPRVYVRTSRQRQDLAVLLLLDLSASTGPLLALIRSAARLLARVLARTGADLVVHGFCSNGRHQVIYQRIKDRDDRWTQRHDRLLEGLVPRLSTRMGAALRHAGAKLDRVRRQHRLLLLLTDGEPSDIDAPDPAYLVHDAAHAVGEIRRRGQVVFALSLDRGADPYLRRIFGDGRYRVLDTLQSLPELLPHLYLRIARGA